MRNNIRWKMIYRLKKYKNKNIKLFLIDNGGESYKYANEDSIYGNLISVADYLETGKMY